MDGSEQQEDESKRYHKKGSEAGYYGMKGVVWRKGGTEISDPGTYHV